MTRTSVDARCIHGFANARCTICIDYTTEPHLPTEGMYRAPNRDGEVIRVRVDPEESMAFVRGPRPTASVPTTRVTHKSSTLDRLHAASAERERTRPLPDYPQGEGRIIRRVTVTAGPQVDDGFQEVLDAATAALREANRERAERLGVSL